MALLVKIGTTDTFPILDTLGFLTITAVTLGGVWYFGRPYLLDYTADIATDHVELVEGRIRLETSSYRQFSRYVLHIIDLDFDLSREQFLALSNHLAYRIFYAPQSRFIYSIEKLKDDEKPTYIEAETEDMES